MSAFTTLIAAETSVVDYYPISDARGTGTFGPNFFPTIGTDEMLRYGDDSIDTFQVVSESDFGYQYVNTGLDSGYFGGAEIDYNDDTVFTVTSPAPWSLELVCKIEDNTNVTALLGVIDNVASSGLGLAHDPAQGLLLYASSPTVPDAIYANPDGISFAGEYHHIVLVVSDPLIKVYVDNVLVINITQSLTLDGSNGSEVTYGLSYYLGFSFTSASGILDEFVVYNKALAFSAVTAHYNALTGGTGVILDHHNIPLSFWRGGDAVLDFVGDGQFERWRGGTSPVLSLSEVSNKIHIYADGYIFNPAPHREVTATGIVVASSLFSEVTADGFIGSNTFVYADGIVTGVKRLYPRDSKSRTNQIVNRNYPLEP